MVISHTLNNELNSELNHEQISHTLAISKACVLGWLLEPIRAVILVRDKVHSGWIASPSQGHIYTDI